MNIFFGSIFIFLYFTLSATAQSALQAVAFIDVQRRITDEAWRVEESPSVIEFYSRKNENAYRKIEKFNSCKYKISFKRAEEKVDSIYNLDFSNFSMEESHNDQADGLGLVRVYLSGIKVCNISNKDMNDKIAIGACLDKFERVVWLKEFEPFRKAVNYLSANFCKPSAF